MSTDKRHHVYTVHYTLGDVHHKEVWTIPASADPREYVGKRLKINPAAVFPRYSHTIAERPPTQLERELEPLRQALAVNGGGK